MAGILEPADIAEFAFLHSDLVKTDPYRLVRSGPLDVSLQQTFKDAQGNRITLETARELGLVSISAVVVEDGLCRLINAARQQPDTVLVGGGISWKTEYRIQLDLESSVTPEMTIQIGDREFEVDAVFEGGSLGLWLEAAVEERSR